MRVCVHSGCAQTCMHKFRCNIIIFSSRIDNVAFLLHLFYCKAAHTNTNTNGGDDDNNFENEGFDEASGLMGDDSTGRQSPELSLSTSRNLSGFINQYFSNYDKLVTHGRRLPRSVLFLAGGYRMVHMLCD